MSTFGTKIKVTIFGESHAAAVGCILEGLPAGERINLRALNAFLARRAPGRSALSSQRKEADEPQFLSGLKDGVLTGAALSAIVTNDD
ncbi:MAG: chorismate synthase, partial [Lentisphaeria bacterium]|nr:chorismate synthase [Lentisphaeria bacterium]